MYCPLSSYQYSCYFVTFTNILAVLYTIEINLYLFLS